MEAKNVPARIVSLTTDFGLKDSYVAEMKAAFLSICPEATFVDISHNVEKFNIRQGAFLLSSAAPYFPDGTIHVAVVDPEVGTGRRSIIVETKQGFLVGPDNGVLMLAAKAIGEIRIHEIRSRRLMLTHVSGTFHGRDVFAPAAAHLANGVPIKEFGPQIADSIQPTFTKVIYEKDTVKGEILHIDDFGNIITSMRYKDLVDFKENILQVELSGHKLQMKMLHTYSNTKPQEPLALIGSHGYIEIALNQGCAAAKFGSRIGDKIAISI
jgi:S-adenosyl-L-methionine hydrolase (adenosine-forming)